MVNIDIPLEDVDTIDYMIYLLNSSELYATEILDTGGDNEVEQWLNNMVNNGKMVKKDETVEISQPRRIDVKEVGELIGSSPAITNMLKSVNEWSFDIFGFGNATGGLQI
jgi:hypothetical protein